MVLMKFLTQTLMLLYFAANIIVDLWKIMHHHLQKSLYNTKKQDNKTLLLHYRISTINYFSNIMKFYNSDRKSTRLNSSHVAISYAVFCLKKKKKKNKKKLQI